MFGMFSSTNATTTYNNNNSNVNQQLSISIHKERDKDNRYYEEEWNIAGKKTKSSPRPRYLKYQDIDVILYPFSAGEWELPRPPGYPRPGGDRGPG